MKARLITQLKVKLSDPEDYKLIDPSDKEFSSLIYSLGDVGLKKLYLINVVAKFLHDRLYVREYKEWDSILKVLEVNPNFQRELVSVCETDAEKDALIKLTFPTRFQEQGALDNNHILLFYFFRDHQELFHHIFGVPDLATNGLIRSLIFIVDALDLNDKKDIAEFKRTLEKFAVLAKAEKKELFRKATSEEAIARYRTGCTLRFVLEENFEVASSDYTQKLVASASTYTTAMKAKATTMDEWWESLHPYDIKVYKRLKSMDTETNKLSDKFLKDKVVAYLRAMSTFDAEVVRYYKENYETIFKQIILEILSGDTSRIYILGDLRIDLDFTRLNLANDDEKLKFVKNFFSIEAILFYIKGIKFEDLLNLVCRDGVVALDEDALQNFAGFVNLQIYKLISYSNAYELLYALYNNTAFKNILFDENVVNILLHSAETHGNKIDLNSVLLTRGLVYNAESRNFQTVNNNFTGHAGNKLRKRIFGENTIALIDATGYSIEDFIKFALEQPQFLDVLYAGKVIGYVKEGKLTREKFARVIAAKPKDIVELEHAIDFVSNEVAQVEQAAVEAIPVQQSSVDDDDPAPAAEVGQPDMANSSMYGGQLITHQQEESAPAVVGSPSPTPPAAQSTMIAGAAYSGTALQTSTSSSSSSSAAVVQQQRQQDKRTKKGGRGGHS